ncbi:MAG: hypothetical protein RML12_11390 [Xanthomonadales bacterium]|nr:hypothetical protein [Xanthomonadales bacterium]
MDPDGGILRVEAEAGAEERLGRRRPPAEQGAQAAEVAQLEVPGKQGDGIAEGDLGGLEEPVAGVEGPDRAVGRGQRRADQPAPELVELGAAALEQLRLLARKPREVRPRQGLEQRLGEGERGQQAEGREDSGHRRPRERGRHHPRARPRPQAGIRAARPSASARAWRRASGRPFPVPPADRAPLPAPVPHPARGRARRQRLPQRGGPAPRLAARRAARGRAPGRRPRPRPVHPPLLFSALGGQLADRLKPAALLRAAKLAEVPILALAALGFLLGSVPLLLAVVFLMGPRSTLFGPVKYAILPRVLDGSKRTGGNARVETGTPLAILLGLVVGGLLMSLDGHGPPATALAVLLLAIAGYAARRRIPPLAPGRTGPSAAPKPALRHPRGARQPRGRRTQLQSVFGISRFWMYGAVFTAPAPPGSSPPWAGASRSPSSPSPCPRSGSPSARWPGRGSPATARRSGWCRPARRG